MGLNNDEIDQCIYDATALLYGAGQTIRNDVLTACVGEFANQWPVNGQPAPPMDPPDGTIGGDVNRAIYLALAIAADQTRDTISDMLFGQVSSFSRVWPANASQPSPP